MATYTVQNQAISYVLTTASVVTFEPSPLLTSTATGSFQATALQGQQITDTTLGGATPTNRLLALGAIA